MALVAYQLIDFAYGLGAPLLAIFLVVLNFRSTANRSFALALALLGLWILAYMVGLVLPPTPGGNLWFRVMPYFLMSVPFAAVHFALVYPRRRAFIPDWLPIGLPLGLLCFLTNLLYLRDHTLFWDLSNYSGALGGPLYDPTVPKGPLGQALPAVEATFAFLAIVFARDFLRAPAGPLRQALFLVSLGFFAPAGCGCIALRVMTIIRTDGSWMDYEATVVGGLFVAALLLYVGVAAARSTDPKVARNLRVYLAVLGVAIGAAIAATLIVPPAELPPIRLAYYGIFSMLGNGLVLYALLRHQLFDIQIKLKLTLQRGTVVAAFAGTYFAVEQVAENVLSTTEFGIVAGAIAMGLLFLVLSPLQRLAHRLADRAMPGIKPIDLMTAEQRLDFYRQQVMFAAADGKVSAEERRMLDFARRRLGIDAAAAQRLERDIGV